MYKMICGILIDDKSKQQHVSVQFQNVKQEKDIFQEKKIYYFDDTAYLNELPD